MRLALAFSLLMLWLERGRAHGTEVRHCLTPQGNLRIFVRHWHQNQIVPNNSDTMEIVVNGNLQTLNPSGYVPNALANALPGCVGGAKPERDASCSETRNVNHWVYFDFNGATCGSPVSYTLQAGNSFLLQEPDSCPDLYPTTISDTFTDTEAPSITLNGAFCNGNQIISASTSSTNCGASVSFSVAASDDCDQSPGLVSHSHSSGDTFPVGDTTVSFTYQDNTNKQSTCNFIVRVTDNIDPTLSCPSDISQDTAPNSCSASVNYQVPAASDNCAINLKIPQDPNQAVGSTFLEGDTDVTWIATDNAGNQDLCTFTVTIEDNEKPNITCPPAMTTSTDDGMCSVVVNYGSVTATDNCDESLTPLVDSGSIASGGTFSLGTTNVGWSVIDSAGNTDSCSFDVTVSDDEVPAIACLDAIVVPNDVGSCSALVTYDPTLATVTDNCDTGLTASVQEGSKASGDDFPVGTTSVTLTADDVATNTGTCSFDVTVTDSEKPSITCPGAVSFGTDDGVCTAVVIYGSVTATDNCDGTPAPFIDAGSIASGETFDLGITNVSWSVSDVTGNSNSCSFDVTVFDDEDPVISCLDAIEVSNDVGLCSAVVIYDPLTATVTDNCDSGLTASIQDGSIISGEFFPVGTTSVILIADDLATNTGTCSFDITVADDEDPDITCPGPVSVGTDDGVCTAAVNYGSVTATDNCDGSPIPILDEGSVASGGTFNLGTTNVGWSVTDSADNTDSCSFDVTVTDNEKPRLDCPDTITVSASSECSATVDYAVTATDNCDANPTVELISGQSSGSSFQLGESVVSWKATDFQGNIATCEFTVIVNDDETLDPSLFSCGGDGIISPCDVPVSYVPSYTKTNGCEHHLTVVSYECEFCNGAGKTVNKAVDDGCDVQIVNDELTLNILDSGGVGDHITYHVTISDDFERSINMECSVCVTKPDGGCNDNNNGRFLRSLKQGNNGNVSKNNDGTKDSGNGPFVCPDDWNSKTSSYSCADQDAN